MAQATETDLEVLQGVELSLEDAGVIEQVGPEEEEDKEHQKRSKLAREPKFPDFHISQFKKGDLLEVMSPYYRIAKVISVRGASCVVESSVKSNTPYYRGNKPVDSWGTRKWNEVWALRRLTFVDNNRADRSTGEPRTWKEDHVIVVDENQSGRERQRSPVRSQIPGGPYVMALPLKDIKDAVHSQEIGEGVQGVHEGRAVAQQEASESGEGEGADAGDVRKQPGGAKRSR